MPHLLAVILSFSIISFMPTAFAADAAEADKQIYGLAEEVYFPELDVRLNAKLDTGALTASISATDISLVAQADGTTMVNFRLISGDKPELISLPLKRVSRIKRRSGDYKPGQPNYTERPVVMLQVAMGEKSRSVEVNLVDRSSFQFPVLLGANALRTFNAIIDPALNYTAGKQDQTSEQEQ